LLKIAVQRKENFMKNDKKYVGRGIDLQGFLVLEANLRDLEMEMILFRELVRENPNYSGEWIDHPQFCRTRRAFRQFVNKATPMLRKRHKDGS